MTNTTTVKQAVEAVLREYKTNTKGTALAYVRLARKMAASGISRVRALELVDRHFPAEHKAFLAAQGRGEKLPVLFPPAGPSYAEKRKLALSRGGIIS